MHFRRQLIDSFVNAIYLYDDKIVLTYNMQDSTETIPLEDIARLLEGMESGSDLVQQGEPMRKSHLWVAFLFCFIFCPAKESHLSGVFDMLS